MKYSTAAWVTAANTTSKRTMTTDENIIPIIFSRFKKNRGIAGISTLLGVFCSQRLGT